MAIRGTSTVKLSSSSNLYLDFNWERTDFSQVNNTSRIYWEIVFRDDAIAARFSDFTTAFTLNIDNVTTNETASCKQTSYLGKESQVIASGSRTITHNADGTKDFNVNFTLALDDDYVSVGDTFTLNRITRASGVTCTTTNIGTAPVITINTQDSRYRHTLSYGFGDQEHGYITGTIADFTSKTVIDDFIWPDRFYEVIPDSREGTGTIFCTTYAPIFDNLNDLTINDKNYYQEIGEQTQNNFTAKVNEGSSTPVFGTGYPFIKDINPITTVLTGNANKLIRYYSTAEVTIGAEGRNYATIARQKVKNGTNYHEEYTSDLVTIGFGNVASPLFSFELEDSRGYISKPGRDLSATGRFIEYFHPTCVIGNDKPNSEGTCTITCNGSWFNQSFGAVTNTLTPQYRYKKEGDAWLNTDAEWHNMTLSASGNSYDASATFTIANFDYRNTYVFQTRVKDKLYTAHSIEYPVRSLALFSWSDQDFEFNVPVIFNGLATFNGGTEGVTGGGGGGGTNIDLSNYALKADIPLVLPNPKALTINNTSYDGSSAVNITIPDLSGGGTITGDLRLKGSGNYGNTLYFGDGSYCYLQEATDDALTIKATTLNLNATTLNLNNKSIAYGSWTPALNSSAISSYTTQSGWYQKIGSTVTIGFNIKATCKSGYQTTSISISGVPFAANGTATGGGMCSGAYVAGGFNFQCWAVASSAITARVQSCNNNTDANLPTSASGCYYRSGGGEITLSGTITYLTNS